MGNFCPKIRWNFKVFWPFGISRRRAQTSFSDILCNFARSFVWWYFSGPDFKSSNYRQNVPLTAPQMFKQKKIHQKKITTQDTLCNQRFREIRVIFKIGDFLTGNILTICFLRHPTFDIFHRSRLVFWFQSYFFFDNFFFKKVVKKLKYPTTSIPDTVSYSIRDTVSLYPGYRYRRRILAFFDRDTGYRRRIPETPEFPSLVPRVSEKKFFQSDSYFISP